MADISAWVVVDTKLSQGERSQFFVVFSSHAATAWDVKVRETLVCIRTQPARERGENAALCVPRSFSRKNNSTQQTLGGVRVAGKGCALPCIAQRGHAPFDVRRVWRENHERRR